MIKQKHSNSAPSTHKEFEQQVARIVQTLSADEATKVSWNERIPDPDNPTQLRQIDIAIHRGQDLTLVECRHRSSREDVQWIEELYGRKTSLGAVSVIAVSSVGFTRGAIAKAVRLGVFLRVLSQIADEEVSTWGARTTVRVTFVQLKSIHFAVVVSDRIRLPTPAAALRTDKGDPFPLTDALAHLSRQLNENNAPEGLVTIQLNMNRVFLGMTPVHEGLISFKWRRVKREVILPVLLVYQRVDLKGRVVEALVERNHHSMTEVRQGEAGIVATVDLDMLPFEECCTLTGAEVVFSKPTHLRGIEIIGPTERTELIEYQMTVMTRSDPRYLRLVAATSLSLTPKV